MNDEYIIETLEDIAEFEEMVGPTCIASVRIALNHVAAAVSTLTNNVNMAGSFLVDGYLAIVSVANLLDLSDRYNNAMENNDTYESAKIVSDIMKETNNILATGFGFVGFIPDIYGTPLDYTVLVLNIANQCLNAGTNIITAHIDQIKDVERQIEDALGNKKPVDDWAALEQQLKDAGASEDEIKALINSLSELESALSASGINTNGLEEKISDAYEDCEEMHDAYNNANDDAQEYRDSFDEDGNYMDPDKNAGDGMGGAAGDAGNAEGAKVDPLILDINKNGFDIETKKYGAHFDLNCDGFAEKINWTRKDAILALDKNHNGAIDDGSEVFGDYHLLADGIKAKNGFEALAQYDTNGDGVIDENDEIFDQLRLWVDENGDGVSDQGELKSLKDMHIKAINLDYDYVNQPTGTEALIGNVATFVYEDDTVGNIGEMWVSSDLYDAIEKVIVGVLQGY